VVRSRDLVAIFLKLGITGFGGPVAHIALMREEFVRRRQWMGDDDFLEMVGIANLIPGPNSTELAMHIGSQQAGKKGLVVAGVCFILPAVVIVSLFSWLYSEYGTQPAVIDLRYGVLPVIIAIVAHALVGLARSTLVSFRNFAISVFAFVAYLMDVHELLVLLIGGAVIIAWSWLSKWWQLREDNKHSLMWCGLVSLPFVVDNHAKDVSLWRLFLVFLQIGAVLYGSGYVLLAFLESRLVNDFGWITSEQLLDAIAIGQVTPGPLFSSATFIGWQVAGIWGAVVATAGIFLPSFVFVSLLVVIVPWVRRHESAQLFVRGVTIASLGLMVGVLVDLVDNALIDSFTIAIATMSLLVLIATKFNATWLIAAGVIIGIAHHVV
jgi:chromate transporter